MTPRFLSTMDALQIHQHVSSVYGGESSIRDRGLLESALAMPQHAFGGEFVHEFPAGMAAAYLFHIAKNHPFVDGNKRAALGIALAFLADNRVPFQADKDELYNTVIAIASGEMTKDQLTEWFALRVRTAPSD